MKGSMRDRCEEAWFHCKTDEIARRLAASHEVIAYSAAERGQGNEMLRIQASFGADGFTCAA